LYGGGAYHGEKKTHGGYLFSVDLPGEWWK
jgi:hypothetical protein